MGKGMILTERGDSIYVGCNLVVNLSDFHIIGISRVHNFLCLLFQFSFKRFLLFQGLKVREKSLHGVIPVRGI